MDIVRQDFARNRFRRRLLIGVVTAVALTAFAYGVSRLEPAAPAVERASVFIDEVERGPLIRQVRGLGSLIPEEIVLIPAVVEGRVERRLALPGTPVEPDTVLLLLSNPQLEQQALDAESALRAAEAQYGALEATLETQRLDQATLAAQVESEQLQAQAQYDADRQLQENGLIDSLTVMKSRVAAEQLKIRLGLERDRVAVRESSKKAQLAAQEALIDQARSMLNLRRSQVTKLEVRAGIRGVLQSLDVEAGQQVAPGAALARVSDPRRLKAELRVPETQAKDVLIGQSARIDTRNGVIEGVVSRIDPAVENATVKVDVRLLGDLPPGARPDLTVDGAIELERLEETLQIGRPVSGQPESLISLFRLEPGGETAVRVPVRLGAASIQDIEVREGLQEGDRVILSDMSDWSAYERIRLR
ncbi:MAG: HlyD family efflux transporter periplasmic adaptor subunit [Acidobacteria bacterium]|nr:HlyD family efflux transporter periplasmic adaptor subunit [Acidobacteriota bacterium]